MEVESSMEKSNMHTDIQLTNEDFAPLPQIPLFVTTWHHTQGFCDNIPEDLENLCREIELSGVTGAMYKEVVMGRYVYWNWKSSWTIVAGYESSLVRRNDQLLLKTRPNKKLKPSNMDWIEPPSIMDFQLGDSLLSQARTKFSGGTYVPPPCSLTGQSPDSGQNLFSCGNAIRG
jgi:hypothetical protein